MLLDSSAVLGHSCTMHSNFIT